MTETYERVEVTSAPQLCGWLENTTTVSRDPARSRSSRPPASATWPTKTSSDLAAALDDKPPAREHWVASPLDQARRPQSDVRSKPASLKSVGQCVLRHEGGLARLSPCPDKPETRPRSAHVFLYPVGASCQRGDPHSRINGLRTLILRL